MNTKRHPQPGGFTLVEVLIVIVIIGILAALIFPVISGALKNAANVREVSELEQISLALESFKEKYGVYPPSRIRLRENTMYQTDPSGTVDAFDAHSVKWLQRIWPDIAVQTSDDNTDVTTPDPLFVWFADGVNTTYELEGDECLVFFLGGIAEFRAADDTFVLHGFTDNPRNPSKIPDATDSTTLARVDPFFGFKADRLFVRSGASQVLDDVRTTATPDSDFGTSGARPVKLPSYKSQRSEAPIVYFSSYEGQGYRPHDCNMPDELAIQFQLKWPELTSFDTSTPIDHVISAGPNPYTINRAGPVDDKADVLSTDPTMTVTDPNNSNITLMPDTDPNVNSTGAVVQYFNPNKFQLISPGPDGKYGAGGRIPSVSQDMFGEDPGALDNLTNISEGKTIGDFDREKIQGP